MDDLTQSEVPGSDAGLEEHGVGGEVWGEIRAGHETKDRDCFLNAARICVADQAVFERFEADVSGRSNGGDFVAGVAVNFE